MLIIQVPRHTKSTKGAGHPSVADIKLSQVLQKLSHPDRPPPPCQPAMLSDEALLARLNGLREQPLDASYQGKVEATLLLWQRKDRR